MRAKRTLCLALAATLALSLAGCAVDLPAASAPQSEAGGESSPVVKEETATLDELHLRDNALLYEGHDPAQVVTMYLTVSTGNSSENTDHTWREINSYSVYDYEAMGVDRYQVAGLLQVGDENGPLPDELGFGQSAPNCTVQIRGQTSSSLPQKNYKISVKDNKGEWNGQTTIALNKHQSDGLRFRNKMAYDLMAGIDEMLGLRTTFVHLYVKDTTAGGSGQFVDYGLYTQVEQLNKTALKAHGLDKNGHLYKINFFEFYRYEDVIRMADDPLYDLTAFEQLLEVKGDDDHTKLIQMLEAVNDYTRPAEEVLEEYFDIENLAYWMAFHLLVNNRDTQSRNVYIYSPLNSNKWYFYSWDNDAMLKRTEYALNGRSDGLGWENGVSNYWGNVLFQRALKTETFRTALDEAVEDLRAYLSPQRINAMAAEYSEIVKPYVYRMPDAQHAPLTQAEYDQVAAALSSEIETNYRIYKESFNNPMPFFIGVPRKEEGQMVYQWDSAYDFDGESVTYTFELASDYTFADPIVRQEGLVIPEYKGETLPAGQYFVRVTATNASGCEQYAFDYYVIESGKVYGVKCFYVNEDGAIVEDEYVEG
ncbi:MAG TPA: CotH kinase family protein [Candidatus Fournierella merdipullorum]|uniref:CotH kinase family protein n=1 Tax=Candidatus Allofournierella merdipullorum TaxID=2838595 RepID=A0A9D2E3I2_9FIRM|nr:CotH kinase family protein [Candidatus Fournierella merdipullorum]